MDRPGRMPAGLVALLALLALTATLAVAADAATPAGPRLAFVQWKLEKPTRTVLLSIGADGLSRVVHRAGFVQPRPFDGPSWSPDGSQLAFAGAKHKRGRDEGSRPGIYLLPAEGGAPRLIPGTQGAGHPVFSPDGSTIAFSRSRFHFHFDRKDPLNSRSYASTTTWILPAAGGEARRLTPWRDGLHHEPTSFAADGAVLLLDRDKIGRAPEVVGMNLATGSTRVIALEAEDAAFSPDGSRIAFVSYSDHILSDVDEDPDGLRAKSELYLMNADGSGLRRLSRTRDWQEEAPSWDPSGQRLAYTRTTGPEFSSLGFTNVVMGMNADGTCPTILYGSRRKEGLRGGSGLYGPAWRPGPGREAAPVSC